MLVSCVITNTDNYTHFEAVVQGHLESLLYPSHNKERVKILFRGLKLQSSSILNMELEKKLFCQLQHV